MTGSIDALSAPEAAGIRRTARQQTTLLSEVKVSGLGMHTGRPTSVLLRPAPAGSGITFLTGDVAIPAKSDFVVNTRRCTCLGADTREISTVEHLLSAFTGLDVDNAEIVVDGGEIPILDGSAAAWVETIRSVGTRQLDQPVRTSTLSAPIAFADGDTWMVATPSDSYSITCVTSFDHRLLGLEVVTYRHSPEAYAKEVALARTFGFIEEVEALRAAGLAQGGSLENALIIYPDHFSDNQRIPNECNRHKLLDLIGDLALVGSPFNAAITAVKPSHRANSEFARLLSRSLKTASYHDND